MDLIMIIILSSKSLQKNYKAMSCLGENIEKYITFTVPIEEEVRKIDKNG